MTINPPSDIASAYNRWAVSYDSDVNATRDLDGVVLRDADIPLANARVLELGAGTGKNTAWLADHAASVVGLDFSAEMLSRARRRVQSASVSFVRADLREGWPIENESIDGVIGNLVLEHIQDCRHIFREIARVLRRRGFAYLAELHPDRQRQGSQAQFTDAHGEHVFVPAFVHTIDEFRDAAAEAGLRVIRFGNHTEDGATNATPRLLSMRVIRDR